MTDNKLRELERRVTAGDVDARELLWVARRRAGITPDWDELRVRFAELVYRAEGPSKGRSGIITINMDSCQDEVFVQLGTYDIADWPSWTEVGLFKSDREARQAVAIKLDEVAEAIRQDQHDSPGRPRD